MPEHVVYYFYLFPDEQRNQADGIVLFKTTPARFGTLEETLAMHEAFVREFFSKGWRWQSGAGSPDASCCPLCVPACFQP